MFSFPQLIPANASAVLQGQSFLQSTSGNTPAPNTLLVNGTPGVENLQSGTAPGSSEQPTLSITNAQSNAGHIRSSTNNFVANSTTPQSIVAASIPQVAQASASASATTNGPSLTQPTKIDYALSATTTTLTGLKAIAETSLVPGLSQAAGTASQLLDLLMGRLLFPNKPQGVLTSIYRSRGRMMRGSRISQRIFLASSSVYMTPARVIPIREPFLKNFRRTSWSSLGLLSLGLVWQPMK